MHSSKEEQGEIRKPSSVISAKKQRKTEWERLETSSRKSEKIREHFHAKMSTIKDRNGMDLTEAEDTKKLLLLLLLLQSCLTLPNPMDCSLPGSSARGIFQARVQEWDAIAFMQV